MKQVIQNNKSGDLRIMDVPAPQIRPSSVLVRTLYSAISAGTEKTKVDTAKMSLIQKARSRPDLVKKVLDKAKKEGFWSTYQMVQSKLSESSTLGYSCVGVVEEVGEWVEGIQVGDTVACAGAGYANHAEYNVVPGRLAVRCPVGTPLDQAAFTTIGSIALQGVRQADPKLGERIVVLGMGLIGQITAQLLKTNGCEVLAIDLDSWKLEQARNAGLTALTVQGDDPNLTDIVMRWTRGRGADAVILTASTTSDGPIEQAGQICRDKGRVVIVGAVGTRFPREPFYMKEIDIRIARSYGPGRYDPMYEELGLDYPVGFVRFTEQRNMETFLDLLASKRLALSYLITHRFPIEQGEKAFGLLNENAQYLGILLEYHAQQENRKAAPSQRTRSSGSATDVGFIGLGNYATSQLLPALSKIKAVHLRTLATASGTSSATKSKQYGFENASENPQGVISSPQIGTVFVVTRHDTHARFVTSALASGKNVFVEKPLCLNTEELQSIQKAYDESNGVLCVGFNRRFSSLCRETRELFPGGAEQIIYRVNAGKLPAEHWLKIPEIGGGRLVGEGCHFVDLAAYFARSRIKSVYATALGGNSGSIAATEDCQISLTFENGAIATVIYLTTGSAKLPKEYIEIHGGGRSALIRDFMSLEIAGKPSKKLSTQDKGQSSMLKSFIASCEKGDRSMAPIPASEIWNTSAATLAIIESLRTGKAIVLNPEME